MYEYPRALEMSTTYLTNMKTCERKLAWVDLFSFHGKSEILRLF